MDYLKLQRTIKTSVSAIYEDQIYNGRYEFELLKTYGDLSQCFIKATLSTGNVSAVVKSNFGLKLFKSVRLHDGASTLALITPFSNIARVDLLGGEALEERITSSTQPDLGAFLAGDVVLYIPLMFWFSDTIENSLDLFGRNPLFIEIITNDSKGSMGISEDLVTAKYELCSKYRQTVNRPIPKVIKNSYSTFQEHKVFVPAGSTSITYRLTCPYQCFYVHFLVVSETFVKGTITNYKFNIPNMDLMDVDFLMNYSMSDTDSFNNASTLSVKFGERYGNEKQFIKFSGEMNPTNVTLSFNELAADSYVYTTCEYYTDLFNSKGEVQNELSGLFYSTQIKY